MPTITQYDTETTGTPAPKPDGLNLFLKIDVHNDKATIHCSPVEHAGSHHHRKLVFQADKNCNLQFSNPSIFSPPAQVPEKLSAGRKTPFFIDDSVGTNQEVTTVCSVFVDGTVPATLHESPPRIVVP